MIEIPYESPFDLALCQRVAKGFAAAHIPAHDVPAQAALSTLRLGVWLDGRPTLVEVHQHAAGQAAGSGRVTARSEPFAPEGMLRRSVRRVINAAMDLGPFYAQVAGHAVLGPLTGELRGLKPFRPASLFDMLVMAVTEQQISLAAAHHIQSKLVGQFGCAVDGLPVFPRAHDLAGASLEALAACGLSRRKAEYIQGMARQVVDGGLDLDALESAPDDDVRSRISSLRGFGRWSADYILVRGMARVDAVPYDDLAVRRILGRSLGDGGLLTPAETEQALAPFAPFRGLATFYLLVGSRLREV